jgi:hypothetical protein
MKTLMRNATGWPLLIVIALLTPSTARAQVDSTLRDALGVLMTNQAVQTADFEKDRAAAEAARDTIARALLVNLTSAPITTSSGGFIYRLNPELGTVERASESFGTLFVERALTSGAGNVSFGVAASTASYDRLNGYALDDDSLVTVANRFRDEALPFDTESLTLQLRTSTVTAFANVGVTDRFDVGVAVPFARVNFDGQRLNIYRGTPIVQATASGTASGLADIALRGKYAVVTGAYGGIAAAGEVRLPTGDEENLLGAGSLSWRVLAVGSVERGPVSFHANGGIVRGGISDESVLAGALSLALHPRVTFTTELSSRRVLELRDFVLASAPHPTIQGVDTLRLQSGSSAITLVNAVTGLKWNVSETLVLGGHLLWSLRDRGLKAGFTPTLTLEYGIQ